MMRLFLAVAAIFAAGTTLTAGFNLASTACEATFLHGVASGDPTADAIILWTRATPSSAARAQAVQWLVWPEGGDASSAVTSGQAFAEPEHDFTVKVDVRGALRPQVQYLFRFECGASRSPEGKFHLPLPADAALSQLRYAIFSCADWQWGYFTAYRAAAKEALDVWLHLGDFIYEYPEELEGVARTGLQPPHEAVSLQDYRQRYSHYRRDLDLQRLSAAAPMIAIWDDHELANDAWRHGAANHQPEAEGEFLERKIAALRAYHEWMPTRVGRLSTNAASGSVVGHPSWERWRRFDFGDLASVLLLETRHTGRTSSAAMTRSQIMQETARLFRACGRPPPSEWKGSEFERELVKLKERVNAHRSQDGMRMMNAAQASWFQEQAVEVAERGAAWRLVAQPLVMQSQMLADFEGAVAMAMAEGRRGAAERWRAVLRNMTDADRVALLAMGKYGIATNLDGWMGYTKSRQRIAEALTKGRPISTVVYGGDSHNAWAGTVRSRSGTAVAAEFDVMSVSSPGLERYYPWVPPDLQAAGYRAANPDLMWTDTSRRGYMLIHLNRTMQMVKYLSVNVDAPATDAPECLASFLAEPAGGIYPRVIALGCGSSRAVLGQTRAAGSALQLSSLSESELQRRR